MAGLAPGSGTGIEHPHAVAHLQQGRRELRARVLHRDAPFAEAREAAYGDRLIQSDRAFGPLYRIRVNLRLLQLGDIGPRVHARGVDTQGHGWMAVVGCQYGQVLPGPGGCDLLDEPGRVCRARVHLRPAL